MTRMLSCLPLALSLLSSTALAGPPVPTQEAGGDRLVLNCQINGQSERFVISDGTMADGSGTLQVLAEDLFVLTRDGTTYVIDPTGVQIDRGPDRGKWDCVDVTADAAQPGAAPDAQMMARLVELEGEVANLTAALNAARGDRQAAILMRDSAIATGAATEAELAEALAEIADLTARLAAQEASRAALSDRLSQAEAELEASETQVEVMGSDFEGLLDRFLTQREQITELQGLLAEARAAADPNLATVPAESAQTGDAPAPETRDDASFDADAALAEVDAADLSPIARAALAAAIEQARDNPAMLEEVTQRLRNALGQ